jgi:peptidoglycan/LPS O-acetylase OafA/YrhL
MPEAKPGRLLALDGWRGAAILLVLIGHFFPLAGINLARIGVDLFFALSGRLMAELLFSRATPLPTFFFRRFSRVYPGLAALVILCIIFFDATPLRVGARAALAALTFTANYASVWGLRSAVLDHVWSLCVEEHAYLALGAAAWASRRGLVSARLVILALATAALANGLIRADLLGGNYYEVFWRSDVAAAPILVAALAYIERDRFAARLGGASPYLLALGVILKAATFGVALRYGLGAIAFALAVVSLDEAPAGWRAALAHPLLRRFGEASFSIYLWQQPFYELHARGAGVWTLAAAIACGLASYHGLEAPARLRLNAWFARTRAARQEPEKPIEPAQQRA